LEYAILQYGSKKLKEDYGFIQKYEIDLKNRRDDALRKNTQWIFYILVSIAAIYIFYGIIKAFKYLIILFFY
jgi:hypothetical protein